MDTKLLNEGFAEGFFWEGDERPETDLELAMEELEKSKDELFDLFKSFGDAYNPRSMNEMLGTLNIRPVKPESTPL